MSYIYARKMSSFHFQIITTTKSHFEFLSSVTILTSFQENDPIMFNFSNEIISNLESSVLNIFVSVGGGCQRKDDRECVCHENPEQMGNVKKSRGEFSFFSWFLLQISVFHTLFFSVFEWVRIMYDTCYLQYFVRCI